MQNLFNDLIATNQCCYGFSNDSGALYYCGVQCQEKLETEQRASEILTLYKQLKLQQVLSNDDALSKPQKQSLMYTNEKLINDIANIIEMTETDYPKSYQSVSKSSINNIILTALQLRSRMLQTDPLREKPK